MRPRLVVRAALWLWSSDARDWHLAAHMSGVWSYPPAGSAYQTEPTGDGPSCSPLRRADVDDAPMTVAGQPRV
jgi:hypothetical protein